MTPGPRAQPPLSRAAGLLARLVWRRLRRHDRAARRWGSSGRTMDEAGFPARV